MFYVLTDKFLRLYRTHDGDFVQFKTIPARDVGWSILDTAFSPDGNYIVYSSWSECCKYYKYIVCCWNNTNGLSFSYHSLSLTFFIPVYLCPVYGDSSAQESLSLCPEDRRFCVFSLVFSSDGREILGGANDGYLYVYDRECHQRAFRVCVCISLSQVNVPPFIPYRFFFFLLPAFLDRRSWQRCKYGCFCGQYFSNPIQRWWWWPLQGVYHHFMKGIIHIYDTHCNIMYPIHYDKFSFWFVRFGTEEL